MSVRFGVRKRRDLPHCGQRSTHASTHTTSNFEHKHAPSPYKFIDHRRKGVDGESGMSASADVGSDPMESLACKM